MEKQARLSVDIPEHTLKLLKICAIERGITLRELVLEILDYTQANAKRPGEKSRNKGCSEQRPERAKALAFARSL